MFAFFLSLLIVVPSMLHHQQMSSVHARISTCEPVAFGRGAFVDIPNYGSFEGSITLSLMKKRPIYQYLGIPYAIPPLGVWRFKPPIPWQHFNAGDVYEAKKFKRPCPQLVTDEDDDYLKKNEEVAEDCLYLNVFTTSLGSMEKNYVLKPVMVYIHGGGWYQNSAAEHCPNYLLDHDIVLVTVQYRLGPLGFLNLDHDDAAGNMGLLDTLEAIEWVNKHIEFFGGDNRRVTIVGQSSGGVSVSLMLISPLVKPGLFHQAVIQSGNLFGSWVVDENSKEHALQFAKYVNCSDVDTSALIECLRNVSSYDLILANSKYMIDRIKTTQSMIKEIGISHAVVQKAGKKRFLIQHPNENMKSGNFRKVPLLTGVTKDEGSMCLEGFVHFILDPNYKRLFLTKNNESTYLKNNLFYDFVKCFGCDVTNLHSLELSKDVYLPSSKMYHDFNETVPELVDLAGAFVVKSITLDFARYMTQFVPTYLYTFDFKGRKTKLGYGRTLEHVYFDGVAHSDELLYLFPDARDPSLDETELKIVTYLTSLWSNFVIRGNESVSSYDLPDWPKMTTLVGPYLQIDQQLRIRSDFVETYRRSKSSAARSITSYSRVIIELSLIALSRFSVVQ